MIEQTAIIPAQQGYYRLYPYLAEDSDQMKYRREAIAAWFVSVKETPVRTSATILAVGVSDVADDLWDCDYIMLPSGDVQVTDGGVISFDAWFTETRAELIEDRKRKIARQSDAAIQEFDT